ncbi:hypothetical protein RFI_23340, partial [Reticulomyxa filosa]
PNEALILKKKIRYLSGDEFIGLMRNKGAKTSANEREAPKGYDESSSNSYEDNHFISKQAAEKAFLFKQRFQHPKSRTPHIVIATTPATTTATTATTVTSATATTIPATATATTQRVELSTNLHTQFTSMPLRSIAIAGANADADADADADAATVAMHSSSSHTSRHSNRTIVSKTPTLNALSPTRFKRNTPR